MTVPPGKTESEVLDAIERVVETLAPSFVFGCYDLNDVRQEGRLYALQVLADGKYDPARPLENFLYRHVCNRLINLRRNKYRRNDPPCPRCHAADPCGPWGEACVPYARWLAANAAKANLMRPLGLDAVPAQSERVKEADGQRRAELLELAERVRSVIPADMQSLLLRLADGQRLPKGKREQLERTIRAALAMPAGGDE